MFTDTRIQIVVLKITEGNVLKNLLKKLNNKINTIKYNKFPNEIQKAHQRWIADNGENKRYEYNLEANSIVWDVGGFEGEFADIIYKKYGCSVVIFEPVPRFYKMLSDRFKGNNKIVSHSFGLSNEDKILEFGIVGDASSSHLCSNEKLETQKLEVRDAAKFFREEGSKKVDLIKVNIEGGEYELLDSLLKADLIKNFKNIQVQFHKIDKDSFNKYQTIVDKLSITHELEWKYYFVWECWKLKDV